MCVRVGVFFSFLISILYVNLRNALIKKYFKKKYWPKKKNYEESDRGQTIAAKKTTKSLISNQKNTGIHQK